MASYSQISWVEAEDTLSKISYLLVHVLFPPRAGQENTAMFSVSWASAFTWGPGSGAVTLSARPASSGGRTEERDKNMRVWWPQGLSWALS